MKFVIDHSIPFIQGVFEPYADVVYRDGGAIGPQDVADADALIIRTRTRCGEALLAGSRVKMISTATIGTDHIDLDWCQQHGIFTQNAGGCNAGGVMNYVCSALYGVASRKNISLEKNTIGIIGVGNVGRRVEAMALSLGFKVLRCDPPRAEAEGPAQFCELDYLLRNSDIVTMHVPLKPGTRGMADAEFFSKMKLGAIFINAARGEVVVDEDLIAAAPKLGAVVIDTWNGEPDVNRRLLDVVDIATPHIAGYSYQGKLNGTSMAVRAVARFFEIKDLFEFYPDADTRKLSAVKLDLRGKSQGQMAAILQYNYPVFTDDFMFRVQPERFEQLRHDYKYRREFYFD
ncbi:MAG: 4-phosphoerythronate dehydrogenase [Bacteroidales bacterium]|nr:4-phosphoerythronate dehydrogenase [Bacteroidales bacterium]